MALSGNPVTLGNNANRPGGSVSPVGSSSSSTTDNAIARWDGTTGTLIQNSAVTIADTTGAMAWDSGQNATLTAAASRSMILQSGGATALTLDSSQNGFLVGSFEVGGAKTIGWASSSFISAPSNGVLRITNSAGTDFSRLQFGGTSNSFPALKRSGATIQARLADDSAAASVWTASVVASAAAATVGAGEIAYGGTTQTTVGAAGGASALPATPTGYIIVNVAGTNRVVPFYAAS